jgi:DNA helicase-2/ATP-dependent DNA helicase PcrA
MVFFRGMRFIADLHIHSHFSRATSKALDPENLSFWAQKKGITVIGTGDFTHPGWMSELRDKLVETESGLYRLRPNLQKAVDSYVPSSCLRPTWFLLSGEISCIYKKNGLTRKLHHLILMPDMGSVLKLNKRLGQIGNISSDGRPILGFDSRDLLEITLEASERAFFIPAHVWTPWFSVFGSKSGFDCLEECFEDLTGHIHALETGLSSDPPMNRRLSALDNYLLVSNSDAHSPAKLGREANVFDTDLDYSKMIQAMTGGNGFLGTVEFYPEEGKYHLDGHRKCQVRMEPEETERIQGICPVCGRQLTVGVLNRVNLLSDRDTPKLSKDFFSLIPLPEILSELLNTGPATKKVTSLYEKLLSGLGAELEILMDVPLGDIEAMAGPVLAEAIARMRRNQVICEGGYDGQYGIIRLFRESEKEAMTGQMALFEEKAVKYAKQPGPAPRHRKGPDKKQESIGTAFSGDPILDRLNPEQRSAVLHEGDNLLVVAGPGTGKTLTLTHRIAQLIRAGIAAPPQILALTFTRKAAREMGQRISRLIEGSGGGQVQVATFHGFCVDVLRSEGQKSGLPADFTLCSEWDVENIGKEVFAECGEGKRSTGKFLRILPTIKATLVLDAEGPPLDHALISLFRKYQNRLRELGMLDLDDLEVETLRLFRDHTGVCGRYGRKFPWIFVDEYQDTNTIQVELLKMIIQAGSGRLCAIGDPDQAIYGFRGADVRNFHRFSEDFHGAEVITLKRNYRSTRPILEGSAALMGRDKPLECESPGGDPLFLAPCRTESEEAEMIVEQVERLIGGTTYFSLDSGRVSSYEGELSLGFGDIGVLYRLNAQGHALEEALERAGIPFVRSGEAPLISRYPINILYRFLQTLQHPSNPYYARLYDTLVPDAPRIMKEAMKAFPADISLVERIDRGVDLHAFDYPSEESREAVLRLKQIAAAFEGNVEAFLDTLSLERGIDHATLLGDRVALMSLHAAKGLEWPVVFITGCEDRLMPCSLFGSKDDEEERRLLYVGMTRARSRLILSHVTRRNLSGRILNMRPSAFLDTIPEDLVSRLDRGGWKPRKRPHKQLELF